MVNQHYYVTYFVIVVSTGLGKSTVLFDISVIIYIFIIVSTGCGKATLLWDLSAIYISQLAVSNNLYIDMKTCIWIEFIIIVVIQ